MTDRPSPDREDRWNALTNELTECLAEIGEDMCFILAHHAVKHYVQVAGSENGDLRLEAASNTYIEPPSVHGSPNFFRNVDGSRVDHAAEARLLVDTLRLVYEVADPDELRYDCFHNVLGGVGFEGLSVVRRRWRAPGVI